MLQRGNPEWQRVERLRGRDKAFTDNLPSLFKNVPSVSNSFWSVRLLTFGIKERLWDLLPRQGFIPRHTAHRANRSLAACHLGVPRLLSLLLIPPSLTCPAYSFGLISFPSAAVSRSKKGVVRGG